MGRSTREGSVAMVDQWARAGGSLWLDAILYDTGEHEPDVLLRPQGQPEFSFIEMAESEIP